jgi:hypothetical protein
MTSKTLAAMAGHGFALVRDHLVEAAELGFSRRVDARALGFQVALDRRASVVRLLLNRSDAIGVCLLDFERFGFGCLPETLFEGVGFGLRLFGSLRASGQHRSSLRLDICHQAEELGRAGLADRDGRAALDQACDGAVARTCL